MLAPLGFATSMMLAEYEGSNKVFASLAAFDSLAREEGLAGELVLLWEHMLAWQGTTPGIIWCRSEKPSLLGQFVNPASLTLGSPCKHGLLQNLPPP